jgi:hypothetical protein
LEERLGENIYMLFSSFESEFSEKQIGGQSSQSLTKGICKTSLFEELE